ncbi:DUF2382 domain-containing protein [Kytococcus sedentarius]|uniref:DUF2382 domain-containing protein n=1 Tax=Kytococcus sedentarius TaxID=1276 RepID=UPI00194F59EA|nr:PRC and DUF2382 domain-containing protein [Kytococcus sedentarius]QRO87557.1 PRC and DUF2382 domain-containing protein [Kytococcus sedentarius]
MISKEQLQDLRGGDLFGTDNEKIGSISDIYLDDQTGQPAWATVNVGMFSGDSFVPLDDATIADGGLAVPYTKDKVKDAPQIEAGQHLDAEHEVELYRYYGVQFDGDNAATDTTDTLDRQDGRVDGAPVEGQDRGEFGRWDSGDAAAAGTGTAGVAGAAGYAGRDTDTDQRAGFFGGDRGADATTAVPTAAAGTDYDRDRTADYDRDRAQAVDGERTSVTRHEERLNVGKERRETGAVRLKKYVVEEDETISVPLERESIEVERRDITDGQAIGDWDFGDDELEITLIEEHPVISKEVYAVEEIGLNKKVVTENRQVTERVRRERVDIEGLDDNAQTGRDNGGLFGGGENDRI